MLSLFNRRISGAFMVWKKDVVFVLSLVFKTSLSDDLLSESPGSPQPVIPANAGTQRSENGKTPAKPGANEARPTVPDLGSRLRGNDEKRDCVLARMRKTHQNPPTNSFKEPSFLPLQKNLWANRGSIHFVHSIE